MEPAKPYLVGRSTVNLTNVHKPSPVNLDTVGE
jgi:hypothetical protein